MHKLKIQAITDKAVILGGYGVVWGGRDLVDEFFTPETDFWFDRITETPPILYQHGQESPFVRSAIGSVIKKSIDDVGLWLEMQLIRSNEYIDAILEMVEDGRLGLSSGAVSHLVEVDRGSGKIISWPIAEFSLTPEPAEPRTLGVEALRSLVDSVPAVKALMPKDGGDPSASVTATDPPEFTEPTISTEVDTMDITEEKLREMLVEVADAAATKALADYTPPEPETILKSAGFKVVKDDLDHRAEDPELQPYKTLGEQLVDIVKASQGGTKPSPRLLKAQKAISGLSELVPADGGFLVQTDIVAELMRPMYETGDIMSRVRRFSISGNANSIQLHAVNETSRVAGSRWGGVLGYWLAEGDVKSDTHPTFRRIRLTLNKLAVLAYATDEVLQDAALLESVVGESARNELIFMSEDSVIRGTGAGQPQGLLTAAALVSVAKETGQAADTIVAENVLKMWSRRWPGGSYVWLVNVDATPQLYQMALDNGTAGSLVYTPPGGLSGAPYATLFGAPVLDSEYCSTVGDLGDILLVDLSQYYWAEKGGIQGASSMHVRFVYDEMTFRFVVRVDGEPSWASALTPFQGTNTISPFVALAERA